MPMLITEVENDDIKDGDIYFIAIRPATKVMQYKFAARSLNGTELWSVKPSIAKRYEGSDRMRGFMRMHPELVAVAVDETSPPHGNP